MNTKLGQTVALAGGSQAALFLRRQRLSGRREEYDDAPVTHRALQIHSSRFHVVAVSRETRNVWQRPA